MSRRIQVASLEVARISQEIRLALHRGLDSERIADFLATIDWSAVDRARPAVKDQLGKLEMWSTQYAEGDLNRYAYMTRLATLLPPRERSSRLLFAPGDITVEWFGLPKTVAAPQSQGVRGTLVRPV